MPKRKPPANDEQIEIFSAIFNDIVSRETQDTMEAPFLSLAKKPRFRPIRYSGPNGTEVTVSGGEPHGIANIFDWDLIIWLLSQVRHAADKNESVSRRIRFNRHAYLKDVRRSAGGSQYKRLEKSIARLKNTMVSTTIRAKQQRTIMFNWLEFVEIDRDDRGNLKDVTVVLPEWLFEAVSDHRLILTLHRDYFLLTGGLERWLYRIIRKSAGNSSWSWRLRTLHERSGSTQEFKQFAHAIRGIAKHQVLLDYKLQIKNRNSEQFLFAKKQKPGTEKPKIESSKDEPREVQFLRLKTITYERVRKLIPRYDVYELESQWRDFNVGRESEIKNPDAAFVAFCKIHAERNPIPSR